MIRPRVQSYMGIGVGLLRATGAGESSAGLARGSGIDNTPRRRGAARGWAKWLSQVAIADSGERACGDAGACAWAWTDAQANTRKTAKNATALNAATCIVFPPCAAMPVAAQVTPKAGQK
jgi:hypothetical protein